MAISIFLLWLTCFAASQTFPALLESIGPAATFRIHAACSLASMLFVILFVSEAEDRTLEEIECAWRRS